MPFAQKILSFRLGSAKKETVITYTMMTENDDEVEAILKIKDRVHPDLVKALNNYLELGIESMCLDNEQWLPGGSVAGLTMKHSDDGVGVVFILRLDTTDKVRNVTTNYFAADDINQYELGLLQREIIQCVNGKREYEVYEQAALDLSIPEPEVAVAVVPERKKRTVKQSVGVTNG